MGILGQIVKNKGPSSLTEIAVDDFTTKLANSLPFFCTVKAPSKKPGHVDIFLASEAMDMAWRTFQEQWDKGAITDPAACDFFQRFRFLLNSDQQKLLDDYNTTVLRRVYQGASSGSAACSTSSLALVSMASQEALVKRQKRVHQVSAEQCSGLSSLFDIKR